MADEMKQKGKQDGFTVIELLITVVVLLAVSAIFLTGWARLIRGITRENRQSDAISQARNGMEMVAQSLRDDLVQFNTTGSSSVYGVNFDLNDGSGNPAVRDGVLYYVDRNHTANFQTTSGIPQSLGLDDCTKDGQADLVGIGLVPQVTGVDGPGVQDFIDLNRDGKPDDLDGDGNPDPLWTLNMVYFNNLSEVTNVSYWKKGRVLARDVYPGRITPSSPLAAYNLDTFQFFSEFGSTIDNYDTTHAGIVSEVQLGNVTTADGIIDNPAEIALIDSVKLTLHIAEVAQAGLGPLSQTLVKSDITSDVITPRALMLYERNGVGNYQDPTATVNIDQPGTPLPPAPIGWANPSPSGGCS
jgi:prepilin-type N-terminal cleavage/methylation domain-containing protein